MRGLTNEAAWIWCNPVSASASISLILSAVAIGPGSIWNPSRGPSSWISTCVGRSVIVVFLSIACVARRPGEGDGVAHIGEAGRIGDRALEAETEAGMRHGAVASEVPVPGVMLLVDAALRHAGVEHIEPLLALAAADDLADAGRQHVH